MVTRWGMSARLGPRTFGRSEELVFLGREISETRNYSEKVAEEIDDEVRALIEQAQGRARTILSERRPLLDKLANVLLEIETIEGDALTRLLDSDPSEPWPPADLELPKKAPPPPTEVLPRRPSFEPKPQPGLAWEGGSQSRIDGSP
jgi:cell division protease FtsH